MLKINFKDLISSYDQNLLDNLRGFGKDDEYLKFWVPGTNNYQSFLNLIDALIESKIYKFKISFNNVPKDNNFLEKVDKLLINVSIFLKEDNNEDYEINLDESKYLDFKKKNKKNLDKKLDLRIDKTKIAKIEKNDENLTSIYRDSLSNFSPQNYFSKKIDNNENIYKSKFNNISLYFEIEQYILVNVFHDSSKNTEVEKLINAFFDLIINKNIQEAADHGVIYLEEKIRTFDNAKVSQGIILPRQGGEYFNILNNIIRNVFKEYKLKNRLDFDVNRNYFTISNYWKNLPEKEKLNKINKILEEIKKENSILTDESILINKIENNFKINLDVDKNFIKLQSQKNLLLEIERKLKSLDQTLEVFIEEILDQNKLRLKNSPQKL